MSYLSQCGRLGFLMYRVELKEFLTHRVHSVLLTVPNVPCGVESKVPYNDQLLTLAFLMYRVELKVKKMKPQHQYFFRS